MSRPRVINDCLCHHCGKLFHPTTGDLKRDKGRYCSWSCSNHHRHHSLAIRFFEGIGGKTPTGCILWARSALQIRIGNRGGQMFRIARVAYELLVGPIPEGLSVLHRCDNPRCINPVHLFLGTHADNMADKVAKGRQSRGEHRSLSKLTEDNVREIRRRCDAGESHESVAKEFHICRPNVSMIAARARWKHVL